MLARGIAVSHETIRTWCTKFGPEYARGLRRRAPRPGDIRLPGEVFVKIGDSRKYLWRSVFQDGNVLDVLVQSRRNAKASKRFFGKLMRNQARTPRVLITDKLVEPPGRKCAASAGSAIRMAPRPRCSSHKDSVPRSARSSGLDAL